MRLIDIARGVLVFVSAVALAAMALHIGLDVASKYLFNAPLYGTIEIVKYVYMVAVTVLPLAAVAAAREHVIVEVFTQRLRARARNRLDVFAALVTLIYLGVFGWACLMGAWSAFQMGEYQDLYLFDLPTWPMRWVFLFGIVGMGLVVCVQLAELIGQRDRTDHGTDDDGSD